MTLGLKEIVEYFWPGSSFFLNFLTLALIGYLLTWSVGLPRFVFDKSIILTLFMHGILIALVVSAYVRLSPKNEMVVAVRCSSFTDPEIASSVQEILATYLDLHPRISATVSDTNKASASIKVALTRISEAVFALDVRIQGRQPNSIFRSDTAFRLSTPDPIVDATKKLTQDVFGFLNVSSVDLGAPFPNEAAVAQTYVEATSLIVYYRHRAAIASLKRVIERQPSFAPAHYKSAIAYFYSGDEATARNYLLEAIRLLEPDANSDRGDANVPMLLKTTSFLLFTQGHYVAAEVLLRYALTLNESDQEARFWLAIALKRQSRFADEIEELLNITTAAGVWFPVAHAELSIAYRRIALATPELSERSAYARRAITESLNYCDHDPTNGFARMELGNAYKELGYWVEAVREYKFADSLILEYEGVSDPYRIHVFRGLGNTFAFLDRWSEAFEAFGREREISEASAQPAVFLVSEVTQQGVCAFVLQKDSVAESLWKSASVFLPVHWAVLYWQAQLALRYRDLDSAKLLSTELSVCLRQSGSLAAEQGFEMQPRLFELLLKGDIAEHEGVLRIFNPYYEQARAIWPKSLPTSLEQAARLKLDQFLPSGPLVGTPATSALDQMLPAD